MHLRHEFRISIIVLMLHNASPRKQRLTEISLPIQYHMDLGRSTTKKTKKNNNNKMTCASSEYSDQPAHLHSLIRAFVVRVKKQWVLSYPLSAQRRLWSARTSDAQADLSLRWAHMSICWFCRAQAHFIIWSTSWENLFSCLMRATKAQIG